MLVASLTACTERPRRRDLDIEQLRALGYVDSVESLAPGAKLGVLRQEKDRLAPGLTYFSTVGDCSGHAMKVALTETDGAFEQGHFRLVPGLYKFSVENQLDRGAGFVLTNAAGEEILHIGVGSGQTGVTDAVQLETGTYEYFCPANPTPRYRIVVPDIDIGG